MEKLASYGEKLIDDSLKNDKNIDKTETLQNSQLFFSNKHGDEKNYSCDFNKINNHQIDMTISGKFLAKRKVNVDFDKNSYLLDTYAYDIEDKVKQKIKSKYGLKGNIVINAGANGVLQNILKMFFLSFGELLTTYYSFEQPQYAALSMKGSVRLIKHREDFSVDFEEMRKAVNENTRAIYLCNPNNPTGICEANEKIIEFCKSVNVPVIVDETTIDFSENKSLLYEKDLPDNLIVVQSFSKSHGFSGLRTGYAYLSDRYIAEYYKNTTIHSNSHLALYIINEHFNDGVEENIEIVKKQRDCLFEALQKLGFEMIKSQSNTLLSRQTYDEMFFNLLDKNGIGVVKVKGGDNKYHFRIAVQTIETNKAFIDKMNNIKNL